MLKIRVSSHRLLHYYDSMEEWLREITIDKLQVATHRYGGFRNAFKSAYKGGNWHGKRTYPQAWDAAMHGVEIDPDKLAIRDEVSAHIGEVIRDSFAWDVTGEAVDIGAYLNGEPECMLTTRQEQVRARRCLTFIYNGSACAGTSQQVMELKGLAVMALIDALEKTGRFSLSVYYASMYQQSPTTGSSGGPVIKLMDSATRYDPQAMAFALSDPSMFRRLSFGYVDCQENSITDFWMRSDRCYGYPVTLRELPREIYDDGEPIVFSATAYDSDSFNTIRSLDSAIEWAKREYAHYMAQTQ